MMKKLSLRRARWLPKVSGAIRRLSLLFVSPQPLTLVTGQRVRYQEIQQVTEMPGRSLTRSKACVTIADKSVFQKEEKGCVLVETLLSHDFRRAISHSI